MLAENLKEVRIKLGISQGEMAQSLDMLQAQYSNYERGKSKPSADVLEKLALKHKINLNYLLTGKGAMFVFSETEKEIKKLKISKKSIYWLEVED